MRLEYCLRVKSRHMGGFRRTDWSELFAKWKGREEGRGFESHVARVAFFFFFFFFVFLGGVGDVEWCCWSS